MPAALVVAAGLVVVWLAQPPEPPCEATAIQGARQQFGGDAAGVASVDVSDDGRFVTFSSLTRLSPADTNGVDDVYTLDRESGRVTLESVTATGGAADGSSQQARLSGDGRVVVFASMAASLIGRAGSAPLSQVLRRDRTTGVTTLVSRSVGGGPGNGWSGRADVSGDGRYVVFESQATDLVAGPDANHGGSDIYLYDAVDGTIRRVSVTDAGAQSAAGHSVTPAIDRAGRVVAFASTAPIETAGRSRSDTPVVRGIYRRELRTGTTRRLSATRAGGLPNGASFYPALSGDGRRTVFVSLATDLDATGRRGQREQLYLHDAATGRVTLITRNAAGAAADGASRHPALSGDGRFVVFSTDASDLPCPLRCGPLADLNLVPDVYRLDLDSGAVERVSGGTGRDAWWTASSGAAVDAAGHVIAFSSRQPVDEGDLEADDDLFVAVLAGTAADTSVPARPVPCGTPPPPAHAAPP